MSGKAGGGRQKKRDAGRSALSPPASDATAHVHTASPVAAAAAPATPAMPLASDTRKDHNLGETLRVDERVRALRTQDEASGLSPHSHTPAASALHATSPGAAAQPSQAEIGEPGTARTQTLHRVNMELERTVRDLRAEVQRLKCRGTNNTSDDPHAASPRDAGDSIQESKDAAVSASSSRTAGSRRAASRDDDDGSELLASAGGSAPPDLLLVSLMMQMQELNRQVQKTIAKEVQPIIVSFDSVPTRLESSMRAAHAESSAAVEKLRLQMVASQQEQNRQTELLRAYVKESVAQAVSHAAQAAAACAAAAVADAQRAAIADAFSPLQASIAASNSLMKGLEIGMAPLASLQSDVRNLADSMETMKARLGAVENGMSVRPSTDELQSIIDGTLARDRAAHAETSGTSVDAGAVLGVLEILQSEQRNLQKSVADVSSHVDGLAQSIESVAETAKEASLSAQQAAAAAVTATERIATVEAAVQAIPSEVQAVQASLQSDLQSLRATHEHNTSQFRDALADVQATVERTSALVSDTSGALASALQRAAHVQGETLTNMLASLASGVEAAQRDLTSVVDALPDTRGRLAGLAEMQAAVQTAVQGLPDAVQAVHDNARVGNELLVAARAAEQLLQHMQTTQSETQPQLQAIQALIASSTSLLQEGHQLQSEGLGSSMAALQKKVEVALMQSPAASAQLEGLITTVQEAASTSQRAADCAVSSAGLLEGLASRIETVERALPALQPAIESLTSTVQSGLEGLRESHDRDAATLSSSISDLRETVGGLHSTSVSLGERTFGVVEHIAQGVEAAASRLHQLDTLIPAVQDVPARIDAGIATICTAQNGHAEKLVSQLQQLGTNVDATLALAPSMSEKVDLLSSQVSSAVTASQDAAARNASVSSTLDSVIAKLEAAEASSASLAQSVAAASATTCGVVERAAERGMCRIDSLAAEVQDAVISRMATAERSVEAVIEHVATTQQGVRALQHAVSGIQDAVSTCASGTQMRELGEHLLARFGTLTDAVVAVQNAEEEHSGKLWDAIAVSHRNLTEIMQTVPQTMEKAADHLEAIREGTARISADVSGVADRVDTANDGIQGAAALLESLQRAAAQQHAAVDAAFDRHASAIQTAVEQSSDHSADVMKQTLVAEFEKLNAALSTAADDGATRTSAAIAMADDAVQGLRDAASSASTGIAELQRMHGDTLALLKDVKTAAELAGANSEEARAATSIAAKEQSAHFEHMATTLQTVPDSIRDAVSTSVSSIENANMKLAASLESNTKCLDDVVDRFSNIERILQQLVVRPIVDEELRTSVQGVLAGVTQIAVNVGGLRDHLSQEIADASATQARAQDVASARLRSLEDGHKQGTELLQRAILDTKKNLSAVSDSLKLGMHARSQESKEVRSDLAAIFSMLKNISGRMHAMATQRMSSPAAQTPGAALSMLTGVVSPGSAQPRRYSGSVEDERGMSRSRSEPLLDAAPPARTPPHKALDESAFNVSSFQTPMQADYVHDDAAAGVTDAGAGDPPRSVDGERATSRARQLDEATRARQQAAAERHRARLASARRGAEAPSAPPASRSFASLLDHEGAPSSTKPRAQSVLVGARRGSEASAAQMGSPAPQQAGRREPAGDDEGPEPPQTATPSASTAQDRAATAPRSRRTRRTIDPITPSERRRIETLYEKFGFTPRAGSTIMSGEPGADAGQLRSPATGRSRRRAPRWEDAEAPADGVLGQQWVSIMFPSVNLAAPTTSPPHAPPLPPARSRSRDRMARGASERSITTADSAYKDFTGGARASNGASETGDVSLQANSEANAGGAQNMRSFSRRRASDDRSDFADDDDAAFLAPYGRHSARRRSSMGSVGSVDSTGRPRTGPRMVLYA